MLKLVLFLLASADEPTAKTAEKDSFAKTIGLGFFDWITGHGKTTWDAGFSLYTILKDKGGENLTPNELAKTEIVPSIGNLLKEIIETLKDTIGYENKENKALLVGVEDDLTKALLKFQSTLHEDKKKEHFDIANFQPLLELTGLGEHIGGYFKAPQVGQEIGEVVKHAIMLVISVIDMVAGNAETPEETENATLPDTDPAENDRRRLEM